MGGSLRKICRTKVTKNRTFKNHFCQKKSTKNDISRKTKYISFRAIFGGILPKEKILGPKLATGEPISRKCRFRKKRVYFRDILPFDVCFSRKFEKSQNTNSYSFQIRILKHSRNRKSEFYK